MDRKVVKEEKKQLTCRVGQGGDVDTGGRGEGGAVRGVMEEEKSSPVKVEEDEDVELQKEEKFLTCIVGGDGRGDCDEEEEQKQSS